MIKNKKLILIITSIVILLPIVFGLVMWNELDGTFATHWGADGSADGYSGKAFAVFGLPLILLAFHWLCVLITEKDNSGKKQNKNLMNIVLWIIPVISLLSNGVIYMAALGREIEPTGSVLLLMGILFVLLGNYMPKCRQNFTMGIKIRWTLANEENWNATHRFAGKVWVIGGIIILFGIFLPIEAAIYSMLGVILILVLIPFIYSGLYYKKQVKEGRADPKPIVKIQKWHKTSLAGTIAGVAILLGILFFVFAGAGFEVNHSENAFTVDASGWNDLTVEYSSVESVEYRENFDIGRRISGFGSLTLSMGLFKNDEFGNYTVYANNNSKGWVVIKADGKVLVFAHKDLDITKDLYEKLMKKSEDQSGEGQ